MAMHPETMMIEEVIFSLIPMLASGIPGTLLSIASYVLTSMALYTVATRRGIGHAWLSWIPLLNVWIIGSLSDQYRYVVKGKYKSKRKWLLILTLLNVLCGICAVVGIAGIALDVAGTMVYGIHDKAVMRLIMGPVMGIAGLALPIAGLSIAVTVIRFMAMYDLYSSMDPANSVMFLVLSILFPFTEPFFLFFSRNKDEGMPPRRQEPVYEQPQWQPQEPAADPWEENKDYL
ncbi:MAG: hypothetical protein IJE81_02090 [Oscillospiraceae bacterium]|nr:hypothetical protein [Oscillospiraceae bacterium]MBQ7130688.1 hypothetical protein [Oscillospiraceae bacterium]